MRRKRQAVQAEQREFRRRLCVEAATRKAGAGAPASFLLFTATDCHLSTRGYISQETCELVRAILLARGLSPAEANACH